MDELCDDLTAEHDALDELVAPLPAAAWDLPTPAPGWAVRDQISHLWYFDGQAVLAVIDPDAFAVSKEALLSGGGTDPSVAPGRAMTPSDLLDAWRTDRRRMVAVFRDLDPKARIPWFGPAMSAASFATARLMETWAHGQDVVDTIGTERPASDRLRHIAHIGVRARPFSYATRGLTPPEAEVRVELTAPGGDRWTWGPEDAVDRVEGSALDFCLVVTQRRHPADTALVVVGPAATEWISIAQAFAGPAGVGRRPGEFAS